MQRNQIFFIVVIVLILINTGLLLNHYFFSPYEKRHEHGNDRSWIVTEVGLTKEQEEKHIELRKAYFKELGILNDSIRCIRARFVAQSATAALTDSLSQFWSDSINRWHRWADELAFQHTCNVRKILQEKQKPLWDSMVQVIMLRKRED
ncbi:MAG: hypothetical protein FJX92_08020 [Bacteroidetes bacterium]|nr:hypothetical protein [Bacteroidota bacterium]